MLLSKGGTGGVWEHAVRSLGSLCVTVNPFHFGNKHTDRAAGVRWRRREEVYYAPTYSRRRLWVTHTWLSSSYQEEEEKKKQKKNKGTCGKWYSHTHRISCTMTIEISLQMRQKHRKAFSLRLHWMNNWILQTVPITKSQLKSRLVAFMISLFLLLWIVFTLPIHFSSGYCLYLQACAVGVSLCVMFLVFSSTSSHLSLPVSSLLHLFPLHLNFGCVILTSSGKPKNDIDEMKYGNYEYTPSVFTLT